MGSFGKLTDVCHSLGIVKGNVLCQRLLGLLGLLLLLLILFLLPFALFTRSSRYGFCIDAKLRNASLETERKSRCLRDVSEALWRGSPLPSSQSTHHRGQGRCSWHGMWDLDAGQDGRSG